MESKYRLVNSGGQCGIYRVGGGYVVDPNDTLMFNDEVRRVLECLTTGCKYVYVRYKGIKSRVLTKIVPPEWTLAGEEEF